MYMFADVDVILTVCTLCYIARYRDGSLSKLNYVLCPKIGLEY